MEAMYDFSLKNNHCDDDNKKGAVIWTSDYNVQRT